MRFVSKKIRADIQANIENKPVEVMIAAVSKPEAALRILPLLKEPIMKSHIGQAWQFIYSALTTEKIVKDNGKRQFSKKSLLESINSVAPDNEETRKNSDLMNLKYSILGLINQFPLEEAKRREIFYNFGGVNFSSDINIKDLCLKGANLYRAKFQEILLKNVDFSYANLKEAYIGFNHLGRINFSHANLQSICFQGNFIQGANFEYADLKEGKFFGNSYEKINFTGAILIKTIFGVVWADDSEDSEDWIPTDKTEIFKWCDVNFQSVSNGIFKIQAESLERPNRFYNNVNIVLREAPSIELLDVMTNFMDFSHEQIMSVIRLVLVAYAANDVGNEKELTKHKKETIVKLIESIDEKPQEDYPKLLTNWQTDDSNKIVKSHKLFLPLTFFGRLTKAAVNKVIDNKPMPSVEDLSQTDAEILIKKTADIYNTWKIYQNKKKSPEEKSQPEKNKQDTKQQLNAPTSSASSGGLWFSYM